MDGELGTRLEKIRRRVEKLEDEYDKQDEWKEMLNDLNEIKTRVHTDGHLSENEEFKEIKTEDLKFLLVSYYQAEVLQKFNENRENVLNFTLQFYKEFFKTLEGYDYLTKERKDYYKKITSNEDEEEEDENGEKKSNKPTMDEMAQEREEKIMAFKYKKLISEKLKKIEKEQDYDNCRDYWISYIEICWLKMIDNIRMVKMEIDSIKYIKQQKKSGQYEINIELDKQSIGKKMEILQIKSPDELSILDPNNKLVKNLKILDQPNNNNYNNNVGFDPSNYIHTIPTLDSLIHKQVNSRDYVFRPNNLPVMTLDEFAAKEKVKMDEAKKMEEEAKKNQPNEDSDDEEVADQKTLKAREWDDWKDLNEKGSGNKMKR